MDIVKNGWKSKSLGEIASVKYGFTAKAKLHGTYRYIRITDINNNGELILEDKKYTEEFEESEKYILNENDLLMARTGATFAKVLLYKDCEPSIYASYLIKINFREEIINKLYWYFSKSENYWEQANKLSSGSAQPHFNGAALKQVKFSYPKSLTEQKQIVALLDQAFKTIDQAQQNIEKNIANAKELFQSKLNAIFSQTGEGWEERTLGEACIVERGSSPRPIKNFITDSDDGVNWIKIGDVGENDKYVQTTKQKITKEGAEKSRFVDIGDFILSNSMSFGRAYIMAIQGYIHDGWFVLRIPKEINSDYFWQLLSSPYLKNQFNELAAGAIVKNISGDLVKKAIVPIPPLDKQIQIYEETDLLTKKIEETVRKYEKKLQNLEELKKSILQKAFNGELT